MQKEDWDKVSNNYYEDILSPIKDCQRNLLFEDLESIKNSREMKVIDLGCGVGEAERFLSKNFKEVFAVDFSEGMINKARSRNKKFENVNFEVADITHLEELGENYDIAVSINSIIMPDIEKINLSFDNVNKILKNGGKFFCVLPSMEVYAYQALLIAEKVLKKNKSHGNIEVVVEKSIPENEHDFRLGIVDFDGRQKNYYRFEILWRLKKAGFKNIEIKKILYPWKEFEEAGQTYFPKEDLPWDWYVVCEK